MTHAVEGSFLIISTSFATLRPLVRGVKQQVASLPMVSRLATKPQSTGLARSGPRTDRSHVDVVEYALSTRQEKRGLHSTDSSGALVECSCPQDEDAAAVGRGGSGVCFDCGRDVPRQRTTRTAEPGITWMEMIKT